jgi:hypothetical protein
LFKFLRVLVLIKLVYPFGNRHVTGFIDTTFSDQLVVLRDWFLSFQ